MANIIHLNNTPQSHIYRLVEIDRKTVKTGFHVTAVLYQSGQSIKVSWSSNTCPDTRLKSGVIVSPRGACTMVGDGSAIQISRLVLLERPEASLNLFDTVPPSWVSDQDLLERAGDLWNNLPDYFKALFNTVFWCGERFQRFCVGQSSLTGHHAEMSGNLCHSVEVAETIGTLLHLYEGANAGVAVMAGLLHDAGKADEYGEYRCGQTMSTRGKLLGHKITLVEWLAVARSKMRIGIPESAYLSLMHALTATQNAPAYLGLRDAVTPEALLLSVADRVSGKANLLNRCQTPSGGWGSRHPHLNGAPYTLDSRTQKSSFRGMEALWKSIQERSAKH